MRSVVGAGWPNALRILVERGADPNGLREPPPLHYVYCGDKTMVKWLMERGARIEVGGCGLSDNTPDVAASHGEGDTMEPLVKAGATPLKEDWRAIQSGAKRTGWTRQIAVLNRHPERGR